MAISLKIQDVDEGVMQRLERRARRRGHSTEAEIREILAKAVEGEPDRSYEERLAEIRAQTAGRYHTPAEVLQQESRDER